MGADEVAFLIKVIHFLLIWHFVGFNGNACERVIDIAAGAALAPPLADICLRQLLKPVFEKRKAILIYRKRYADGGLVIAEPGSQAVARELVRDHNTSQANIRIAHERSWQSCIFLDIYLYKGDRWLAKGRLDARVYIKPANKLI